MTNQSQLEAAANKMHALLQDDLVRQLQGANEATTRLRLIDEVLALLGWPKSEYYPEQPTPAKTYTDYRLTLEGQPRLIVEAKRMGLIDPLPTSLRSPDYANSFLFNHCGPEMQSLLQQCLEYCVQCGVPYALATTGEVWIVLIGFKSGVGWDKLRSFVFHSLEDVSQRFSEFYGLVSREAVKKNSLEEKFGSTVFIKPTVAIRPREQVGHPPDIGKAPEKQIIRAFFDNFLGDITRPEQVKMLEQCYVDNSELNEFTRELQRLLQYDPA
ncbi:MAG TPA: hypothetical protein VH593_12925, partial [Ktedonobacteraceae bacterium]